MAVSLPIGFNFRMSAGWITDDSPDVYVNTSTSYPTGDGYGWVSLTGVDAYNDADTSVKRLSGASYLTSDTAQADFRIDCGAGTYDVLMAVAVGYTGYRTSVAIYDGADTSAVASMEVASASNSAFYDGAGTAHASRAAWASSAQPVQVTIASSYMRVRLNSVTPGYAKLLHVSLAVGTAPAGPEIPVLAHHYRQLGVM